MSISSNLRRTNLFLLITVSLLLIAITSLIGLEWQLNNSHENRYDSYLRADELRQSSDDLTRLARTYVLTGDDKYEEKYWHILAVRSGKAARPDGTTRALRDIMEDLGFTAEEFGKLKEAEDNSNDLVTTETIAMHAVKGLFDDGQGGYTRKGEPDLNLARRIMFDLKYHSDKEKIMAPIREFELMMDTRTGEKVAFYKRISDILKVSILLMTLLIVALVYISNHKVKATLKQLVSELSDASKNVDHGSRRMLRAAQDISNSTHDQADSTQRTAASLSEISSMLAHSLERVTKITENAKASLKAANQGEKSLKQVVEFIHILSRGNEEILQFTLDSNNEIDRIGQAIQEISNKTTVINDIAFQTKLLSFNASVESARAGKHGMGFAVVASEVGNLAQTSSQAASEISQVLQENITKVEGVIQQSRQKVSGFVSTFKENVEQTINETQACQDVFQDVLDNVGELRQMILDMSHSSQEQTEAVHNISEALTEIDKVTNHNSQTAKKTEKIAFELSQYSNHIGVLAASFNRQLFEHGAKNPSETAQQVDDHDNEEPADFNMPRAS